MERIALEAQIQMTTQMTALCRERTLKANHTTEQLSEAERTAFANCI